MSADECIDDRHQRDRLHSVRCSAMLELAKRRPKLTHPEARSLCNKFIGRGEVRGRQTETNRQRQRQTDANVNITTSFPCGAKRSTLGSKRHVAITYASLAVRL